MFVVCQELVAQKLCRGAPVELPHHVQGIGMRVRQRATGGDVNGEPHALHRGFAGTVTDKTGILVTAGAEYL